VRDLGSQLPGPQAPSPIAAERAGTIHARVASQTQQILDRNNGCVGDGGKYCPDEFPVNLAAPVILETEVPTRSLALAFDLRFRARAVSRIA
jgi:hypothetical protein